MAKKDRKQRKKKRREERLRQQKHQRTQPSASRNDLPYWMTDPLPGYAPGNSDLDGLESLDEDDDEFQGEDDLAALGLDAPLSASLFAVERRMRLLTYAMNHKQFSNADELRAWVEPFFAENKNGDLSLLDDPKEKAQEFAYRSMESGDPAEIERLAREAIKLDPHCLDALNRLIPFEAGQTPADIGKHLELYKKIVGIGRADLEKEGLFETSSGEFWFEAQTKPFMRVLYDCGNAHFIMGDITQAEACFEEMLELDYEDNLGARFPLLACSIESGDFHTTSRILKTFPDDDAAPTRWAWVFERFLTGDLKTAARALKHARHANPYVTRILAGEMPMPKETGESVEGTPDEAREIFKLFSRSFVKHPTATEWIVEQSTQKPDPTQKP